MRHEVDPVPPVVNARWAIHPAGEGMDLQHAQTVLRLSEEDAWLLAAQLIALIGAMRTARGRR